MKYLFILLLFTSTATFGQRWIVEKTTGYYITDSTGTLIAGTATFLRNYADANMQPEDTATLTTTTVAPVGSSVKKIYQQDKPVLSDIPYLPAYSTSKIVLIQSQLPADDRLPRMCWDRTRAQVCIFNATQIRYITTSP